MSPRLLAMLVACNLIWSLNPAMGKLVLLDFRPAHAGWLRYFAAVVAYLVFALIRGPRRSFCIPSGARDWAWLLALGTLPFCLSTLLNIFGLSNTGATDNALIIAMEPLITVAIARVLLGERMRGYHAAALGLALAGFCLLSGLGPRQLREGFDSRGIGNLLILFSLFGEGAYSSCARKLFDSDHRPVPVFGSSLLIGFGCLTAVSWGMDGPISFSAMSLKSACGVLFLGLLGTTATYLGWMLVLARAPIASMAVTLFLQPIAGSVWGFLFFSERLSVIQTLGGTLILAAIVIPVWIEASFSNSKVDLLS